jgi:hypothetical protein
MGASTEREQPCGDAPAFVEVGEAGIAVDHAMRRQLWKPILPSPAPAVADAAPTAAMRRAGKLLGVLAHHVLHGSDPGRQTEALEGTVHILPSRLSPSDQKKCGASMCSRAFVSLPFAALGNIYFVRRPFLATAGLFPWAYLIVSILDRDTGS